MTDKENEESKPHCIFCDRTGKMNQVAANVLTDKVDALKDTGMSMHFVQMAHDYLAEVQMRELLTLAAFIYDMDKSDKEASDKES